MTTKVRDRDYSAEKRNYISEINIFLSTHTGFPLAIAIVANMRHSSTLPVDFVNG